ncbi:phosphotransferase [Candidatus Woesebacteria bacterium]|nr:phosphotransferase [Candidatus Woesebacteria bacterium]
MKLGIFNLYRLIISSISFSIFKIFGKNIKLVIPKKIKNYNYQRTLKLERGSDTAVALYKDEKGNKVVAKIWMGRVKNSSYFSLLNECKSYEMIHKAFPRIEKTYSKNIKNIRFPKLVFYIEEEKSLILLIEFIDGKSLDTFDDNKIIKTYFSVIEFLHLFSSQLTDKEKGMIKNRKNLNFVIFYLYTLILSSLKRPQMLRSLIKGLILVIKNVKFLFIRRQSGFVHGDLNFKNIYFNKGYIYIMDLEFSMICDRLFEFSAISRYCWIENRLINNIHELSRLYNIREFQNSHKVFNIMYSTHGLIEDSFSKKTINSIYNFLRASL